MQIDKILDLVVDKGASDLHLAVGSPPVVRLQGKLRALNTPPLTPEDTLSLMKAITSERCQQELAETGGADFGFSFGEKARFRVSVFKQKGNVGLVLRQISNKLLTLEQIGLPPAIKTLLSRPRGMFLVTGPTGSGKSTTLASCVDFINNEIDAHIITIEDPIEFYHQHKKSIITQREIGVDVGSFDEAIRRALRQDPDVILVGEMRDLETISAAITAAETGHLLFGTLHTMGAAETINRIVDAFPTNQQEQVKTQLSQALMAVISQTLLPRADGNGRIAAHEIMVLTPAIAHLIREGKIFRINSEIQTGSRYGMQLMDDKLFELFRQKKIKYHDMMEKCVNPQEMLSKVRESGLVGAGGGGGAGRSNASARARKR
ncbi:MAG: type IV pilus twitching motility protein PilT [Planctomycetota bacterium]|nr:MAG: type IV pilus twitching motility protein PilT [Planctomycetota bacterium]